MSADEVGRWVQIFGLPAVLFILILWTGARGVWTWGRETRRERDRGDRYEEIAYRSVHAAEAGNAVARKLAEERTRRATEIAEAVADELARRDASP